LTDDSLGETNCVAIRALLLVGRLRSESTATHALEQKRGSLTFCNSDCGVAALKQYVNHLELLEATIGSTRHNHGTKNSPTRRLIAVVAEHRVSDDEFVEDKVTLCVFDAV
jgi:hypothetical protein